MQATPCLSDNTIQTMLTVLIRVTMFNTVLHTTRHNNTIYIIINGFRDEHAHPYFKHGVAWILAARIAARLVLDKILA